MAGSAGNRCAAGNSQLGSAMTSESVSVVIPCYNASRYIGGALRSVLAQEWARLEVIVVDDGSSDGSPDLVARDFPQVTVLRQANQGAAAARNLGVRAAQGDWIAFIDADDLWLPGKLQAQLQCLADHPGARMVYSAWQTWASEDPLPTSAEVDSLLAGASDPGRWAGPSGWIYPQLLLDCEVWTSTVVAHRALFDEIGLFDTSLRIGEDYDLWLRASRVTPILRVARPHALYRQHPASVTRLAPRENYRSVVVSRALARWGYGDDHAGMASQARVRRALAQSWNAFAAANLEAGEFGRARRGALMSIRTDPAYAGAWKALVKTALRALHAPSAALR